MKCVICQKGPQHGVSLFRINATGQRGFWACRKHRSQTDAPVDPELDRLVDVLEGRAPATPEDQS